MLSEIKNVLGDGVGFVQLIAQMGDDLTVVNDARVSYDNESTLLDEKDIKLIRFLVKHKHGSPFRGVVFKFRVMAPLFVCRQWWKHIIASSNAQDQIQWNELSFRYVDFMRGEDIEVYVPTQYRRPSKTNKQGSEGYVTGNDRSDAYMQFQSSAAESVKRYKALLDLGVCGEQARGVLTANTYTKFTWTVSLQALLNFLVLRLGKGAQSEITDYAGAIEELIIPYVPISMDAFREFVV